MHQVSNSFSNANLRRSRRILLQSTSLGQEEVSLNNVNHHQTNSAGYNSEKSMDRVEGFLGLRRSPRFSSQGLNGKKGRHFTDSSDKVVSQSRKRRVKGFGKDETSLQRGKKKEVICGIEEKCNVICGIEEKCNVICGIEEKCNTHFRSPLKSIENILVKTDDVKVLKPSMSSCNLNKSRKGGLTEEKDRVVTSSKDSMKKVEGGGGAKKSKNVNTRIKEISNHSGDDSGLLEWTKDQELALQRAYLGAKPYPHFWKKVSKLVPGKSAQECFDKIHSDTTTPPQPQPRSRAKRSNLSPLGHLSLSASKLLQPTELNSKWPRTNKQKKCLAHKTVRHVLQKHNQLDHGYQADLFSVLEPSINPFTQSPTETKLLCTPPSSLKKNGLQVYHERSLSIHKKPPLSRYSGQKILVSPPVLKPIKNRVLHEKYIDQLHSREARRMMGGTRKVDKTDDNMQNMDVVTAARNALVSDARDMINQFQYLQGNYEEDDDGGGEEEGEAEP